LLVSLVFFGLYIIPETGIVWDDPIQRGYGLIVYEYVFESNSFLLSYKDRFYGPFFEFLLIIGEKLFGFKSISSVYIYRHWMVYFSYLIGVVFFYLLSMKIFSFGSKKSDTLFACFLSCVFVLTPRVFGHSFMNTKDIPFMVFFLVSMYFLLHFIEKPSIRRAVYLGVSTGILIDIRVIGLFVFGIISGVIFFQIIKNVLGSGVKNCLDTIVSYFRNGNSFKNLSLHFTVYSRWIGFSSIFLVSVLITIYLFWPTLWANPFLVFDSISEMSRFPWGGDVLFMGDYVNSNDLPWTYLFVWMGITIPVLTLIMFLIGLVTQVSERSNWTKISFQVLLLWFLLPLFVIIGKGAVLYDDWRHVYFLYPVVVLYSGFGFTFVYSKIDGIKTLFIDIKKLSLYVCVFYFGAIVLQLVRDREYAYVSFNTIAYSWGSNIGENFELDYWGLSYKELISYAVDDFYSETANSFFNIRLFSDNYPGEINSLMFRNSIRGRIDYVNDLGKADYFITNYRWRKGRLNGKPTYSVVLDNGLLLGSVYK
jgi:hypothetical protein